MKLDKSTTTLSGYGTAKPIAGQVIKAKIVEQAKIEKNVAEIDGREYVPHFTENATLFLVGRILEEVSRASIDVSGEKAHLSCALKACEEDYINLIVNMSLDEIRKFNRDPKYVEEYDYKRYLDNLFNC